MQTGNIRTRKGQVPAMSLSKPALRGLTVGLGAWIVLVGVLCGRTLLQETPAHAADRPGPAPRNSSTATIPNPQKSAQKTAKATSPPGRKATGKTVTNAAATDAPKASTQKGSPAKPAYGKIQLTSLEEAEGNPFPTPVELASTSLPTQTDAEVHAKSWGCVECHKDSHDPHMKSSVKLGCIDCHGGDPCTTDQAMAHEWPIFQDAWQSSAVPVRAYALLNHERPEFIRFMNPSDLRVAHLSCGMSGCHPKETLQVKKSMMTHGCMLWGAALYNNGAVPFKRPRYGESYSMNGNPQRMQTVPPPTEYEMEKKGVLPFLDPLPHFQISQPGNILRIFERGGRFGAQEIGIPEKIEEPGRPRARLSTRGLGTANRTDPVFIGLHKTRLFDPTLNMMGTNDNPGDYRNSGCAACHVIYANDRSKVNSGPYAVFGNRGMKTGSMDALLAVNHDKGQNHPPSIDPTIPENEPGHPISHKFTRAIPTSQCIICHIHPGTTVMNSYVGYMWWDEETDGEFFYPKEQKHATSEEFIQTMMRNPNESAVRSNLADPEFVADSAENLNSQLEHQQLADFHGHGWLFRAVFKRDKKGHMVDHAGHHIEHAENADLQRAIAYPEKVRDVYRNRDHYDPATSQSIRDGLTEVEKAHKGTPVHMLDIHLEKGMHCIDCHFTQDNHGNTKLYGEVRAAVEIQCIDCHGSVEGRASLKTSGPAAYEKEMITIGRNLAALRTPFGKRRFEWIGNKLIQNSCVEADLSWEVKQVVDTVTPGHPDYNALSALSKTVRFADETKTMFAWGDVPAEIEQCAHANSKMSCIACHTSWNPSCYGCHLSQKATKKMPALHWEGDVTKNYTSYNFQTLRDDMFMLAKDGDVTKNRIGPSRSSCAIHVSSYNSNREAIYTQQQTVSGEGLSGISFSTNVPHTVRGRGETKTCTDCHLSGNNDNNAQMAQLLMQGTNYTNFIGRYCWVACGEHGFYAVPVTEREEPQAVIGSKLHEMAFPEHYEEHVEDNYEIKEAHEHPGVDIIENVTRFRKKMEIHAIQNRGEYAYAACGENGLRIFDIAFIEHKGFAERITTAPVSPIGQRFYVRTENCTCVAAPTTIAPDPTRAHFPENKEQPVAGMYAYVYATDSVEGLILVGAGTLLDGNPTNNFVKREVTFNPNGILCGARSITIVGTYAYICCDAGVVIVDIADAKNLQVVHVLGEDFVSHPTAVQVQFRYGFICDHHGIKVIDTTDIAHPKPVTALELEGCHNIYLARNYAYVAGGHQGLIILDITDPAKPLVDQIYNAGGQICDLHDVKLGVTYASQYAYLADGENGMRVLSLTSPEQHDNHGYSPRPQPCLIATFPIPHHGHALAIAKGVDRDRAVDESGNQIAVFGRIGARPLHLDEQRKMYLRGDMTPWTVLDGPTMKDEEDWKTLQQKRLTFFRDFYGAPAKYKIPRKGTAPAAGTVTPTAATVPAKTRR